MSRRCIIFRELIEASEFADRFAFTGWVPTEEMPNYYFESDVGLNIDRASYEMLLGCRYRIMDMLRAGLPVVTSLGTEISLIVRNEKLGVTFTPGNADELARALVEMARDESARRRCAARAKEWVFKNRTVEQVMAPLRRWMQAPARAEVRARELAVNHVWQPRTRVGRFARTWETVGPKRLLRQAAKGVARGGANLAGKAILLRRGTVLWGLDAAHPPHRALVVRAGDLALTRDLLAQMRQAFPEVEITVLAPENLADETRFELDAPVITAPGAGLVSYRITRDVIRDLRSRGFDTIIVAGEGNRRAELLASLLTGRKVEVRPDGAAHTFSLAPYKPLLSLIMGVVLLLRNLGLSALLGVVWGSLKIEGALWRWRHPVKS